MQQIYRRASMPKHNLLEPIRKQCFEIRTSNATYASCASAESLIDTMKFQFESEKMIHVHDEQFLTLYANEPEHVPHMETFSKFASHLENKNFIFGHCESFLKKDLEELTQ